ncbi:MAG: ShlB/FhaC/HecB family hemolysin secretion/activation protein [Sphingobium sp.]|uniref:ShlB/FhaC/HecB family hemolysin secretion/activation protein n=1 Tax=Sphingobium sp. TaxID=1912891 RepID=UPI0029A8DEF7|nr:ShlB/FhaC/HecB family hemolysin secretion/activation protein [Sphingobium sp.]MDX3910483.1 ShlB/FhaC/HecB family hemolysin secretion/activation protein [Sphingobium sp.]
MGLRTSAERSGSCLLALIAASALSPFGIVSGVAMAQAVPPPAPTTGAPTREEIERGTTPTTQAPGPSRLTVEGGVERAPCPLADPRYAKVMVTFADVRFDHLSAVDPASLRDSWAEFAGREVPIATVCEIRDRAATVLRTRGYLAAVQVPPQRIEKGGTVVLDVLMAKLVRVEIRGNAGNAEKMIAAHMNALTSQPVFNVQEAERHLLLARDMPGFDVRLALKPAGTGVPGEVVGEVQVTRRQVQVDVNVQNLGSRSVGRFGALARLQLNDITGMADSTVFSIFSTAQTKEQTVLQVGHSMGLGSNGLRLAGDFTYAWTTPDIVNGTLESETLIASLSLSYPLLRRQSRNLLGAVGLDVVDQKVEFSGLPLNRDKLRVVYARLDAEATDTASLTSTIGYSASEPKWRIGGSLEVRQGLDALGASKPCGPLGIDCRAPRVPLGRVEGDPSGFAVRLSGYSEYRPVPKIAFTLSPRAQYSPDALLSYEEMSAGNYTVGRGYDPGALIGDSGVGFAAEVRVGSVVPRSVSDLSLQPFGFFDAAWIWNNDRSFDGINPQRLYSAGGGVRGAFGNRARFDLTVAVPLKKTTFETERSDVRVLMSVTAQLLPWRR